MSKPQIVLAVAEALISFGAIGCSAGASKQAAEATASKYFQALSQKDWDTAVSLYAPEFFEKTPKKQWREMLANLGEKLGEYQSHQLQNWQYQSHTGTGGSRRVTVLTYRVRYAKGEATEVFTFLGGGDGEQLQIAGHQITSPALLAPSK